MEVTKAVEWCYVWSLIRGWAGCFVGLFSLGLAHRALRRAFLNDANLCRRKVDPFP